MIWRKSKTSKYRSIKTKLDGKTFDSRKEARRYAELKLQQKAGLIEELETQVTFELLPTQRKADGKAEKCVRYIADFVYLKNGRRIVEDVKSEITRKKPDYVIKRKLMLHVHKIELNEF